MSCVSLIIGRCLGNIVKPNKHAKISAHSFGGVPEDYQDIHDFMDCSKMCHGDARHRALLHNTLGCYIAERVLGITRVNSDGKEYSVRDVAEQHVKDDMGGNNAKAKFKTRYRINVPDADPESEASSSASKILNDQRSNLWQTAIWRMTSSVNKSKQRNIKAIYIKHSSTSPAQQEQL